jgi:integrase
MARPWSARCYGVARQRGGSRQNSIGAPACFLSGIFRAGSLYPLARGRRRIWRGERWFRPPRCCSTGSGRLDLDLMISGPRGYPFPLTAAAIALLGPRGAHDELIFRSRIGKKENLGHGAMQLLLKEMRKETRLTVHGFRTSFRDWIRDDTDFDGDLGELALAHAIGGQSKRAYARSDQLERAAATHAGLERLY